MKKINVKKFHAGPLFNLSFVRRRILFANLLLFLLVTAFAKGIDPIKRGTESPWLAKGLKSEVENKRTRTSKSFSSSNKATTAFISSGSIHFLDASNKWEEINTNIVSNSSITHPYANELNAVKTYFPANPFSDFILIKAKEGSFKEKVNAIKFLDASKNVIASLPISANINASVAGNKIVYTGFYPGLSLSYALGNDGRKFDLTILSASFLTAVPAGAQFISIDETVISDEGTASMQTTEGAITLKVKNTEVFGYANPVAYDSNTMSESMAQGTMSFSKSNNAFILQTDFALSWITNPTRSFPVHLDPTVNYYPQTLANWTGYTTGSGGTKSSGLIRIAGATTSGYAKFDISTIPVGAFVQTANYWGFHYTTAQITVTQIRGLGTLDPVPAGASPLFTVATSSGPIYNSTYNFATSTLNQWNVGALAGSAPSDISAAITQSFFALGFEFFSGSATFCYQYGWDAASAANKPYIEVTYFTTPCSGAPAANTVVSPNYSICPNVNPGALTLSTTYTTSGISYQWESSTTGVNGVYSSIANATNASMPTGTLGASVAYRAVITCSNGPASTTATPVLITVGPPAISNVTTPLPLLCPNMTSSLALNSAYQGASYQWQSSSLTIVGPYTNVTPSGTAAATSGTASTYVSPSLTNTTFFQAVVTCTAVSTLSTITNPIAINIAVTTTNSVPYFEGFEGVGVNDFLPNCSWAASSPTVVNQTYTLSNTNNRSPYNGAKFGSFKSPTAAGGDYFYTNGIQLEPGITYSASVWHTTDGSLGWTEVSLWLGTSQTPGSLVNIASSVSGGMVHTYYKNLSNTFTVANSGIYYIAVKAIGNGAQFLSFDDLSVTAPCSLNSPNISVTGPTSGCIGQSIVLTASGANTYTWTGAVNTASLNYLVTGNVVLNVTGKNSASGCTTSKSVPIAANLSPQVGIIAPQTSVCKGSSVVLTAYGANNYNWTNGAVTATISVSPTVTTTYTVIGINSFNCSGSVSQQITVKQLPTISAIASSAQMCAGETVTLTATGANTFTWTSNNNFLTGSSVLVSPLVTTNYTVTGTDVSGCQNLNNVSVAVSPCLGLQELALSATANLYPNPNNGQFTLEFTNDAPKSVEVVDVTGRLIMEIDNGGDLKTDVNAASLSSGIYYVKVTSGKSVSVLKFVKQ